MFLLRCLFKRNHTNALNFGAADGGIKGTWKRKVNQSKLDCSVFLFREGVMAIRCCHSLLPAVLAAAILSGCAGNHAQVVPRIDLLGMPVVDQSATLSHQRTVTITPDTRRVNVDSGDTVRFPSATSRSAGPSRPAPTSPRSI
jgi:hypothetical protein